MEAIDSVVFANIQGETLTTEGWKKDGGYVLKVSTPNGPVMTNAFATIL